MCVKKQIFSFLLVFSVLFFGVFEKEVYAFYRAGDEGQGVMEIQNRLREFGYQLEATGKFDAATVSVIKEFQAKMELVQDGIVGEDTFQKLMERPMPPNRSGIITSLRRIISTSLSYQGVPYHFGGTTPNGFDCSGFTRFVFAQVGINLPRMADDQYYQGRKINKSDLSSGDLVYFTTYTSGVSHVGIYLGGGEFVSATSSAGIAVRSIYDSYWGPRYVGATRAL